ncbi:MAG: glucosylceramidase [Treponema sp.]|nr:glucosylceramidase [Treponema sp.]
MIELYETTKDTERRLEKIDINQRVNPDFHGYSGTVVIDKTKEFQTFKGFGGAITESTGYVLSTLSEKKQKEILSAYYGKEGIGYTFTRSHMNSCDFSLENWTCCDQKDETLESFSMERPNKYIIPGIIAANKLLDGKLNLVITPWSAPAWMKTNNDMNHGGKVKPEYHGLWAQFYVRYIQELKKQNLEVSYISVQNEPAAVQTWDSCEYSAEEEGLFAVNYLRPALDKAGMENIKILVWDHNRDIFKERFTNSMKVPGADKAIAGAAFHWYQGDQYDQVQYVYENFTGKDLFFTEGCVEGGPRNGAWFTGERYAHNIINDLNSGCNAWIDWNLVLDMQGGPNHVHNYCDAPVLADKESDTAYYQSSFYYIGHFSKFIKPGAVRISCTHDNGWIPASITGRGENLLESVAFKNPDGSIVFVITNRTEADLNYHLKFAEEDKPTVYCIPPRSIQTYIFK